MTVRKKNQIREAMQAWPKVSKIVSTIHTEDQYNRMLSILDELIDEVNEKSDPAKESLIDTLGTLIGDYEDRKVEEPEGDSVGVLKFLMEEHGLKQGDLQEIGSQGIVSEVLSGRRKLNLRQIAALSKRFSVSPSVFMDTDR